MVTIMLLPDNIHPEHTIYYNGAFILEVLQNNRVISLLDLYLNTKNKHDLSMPVFVLCLDWLFLLNLIAFDENGRIVLCS
jgi:hypothetical protein